MRIPAHDTPWKTYRRRVTTSELRPYMHGEDLHGISVSPGDEPLTDHGWIARNPANHADQWYVNTTYFAEHFHPTPMAVA